jgi:Zn-dependent protease with chaperone function
MSINVIGLLMACAAIAFGTALGWLLTSVLARIADWSRWPARARATLLAQLRVLPLATAVLLASAQMVAFARFEQNRAETAGPLLLGLALAGVGLLVDAVINAARAWARTASVTRAWRENASPLTLPEWHGRAWAIRPAFPIVAVLGAVRPHLFVARQVIDRCTREEMSAITAHEAAHVAAHDNFTRLLFSLTPGSRVMRSTASRLEQRWLAASEEAADVAASRHASSIALASALTKVARLAPLTMPEPTAASALISGSDLELRVKRLLQPAAQSQRGRGSWLPTVVLLVTAIVSQLPDVSRRLHEVFELLVTPL